MNIIKFRLPCQFLFFIPNFAHVLTNKKIENKFNRIFILLPGSCPRGGTLGAGGGGGGAGSKTLAWGFAMAPHRLRVLVFIIFIVVFLLLVFSYFSFMLFISNNSLLFTTCQVSL